MSAEANTASYRAFVISDLPALVAADEKMTRDLLGSLDEPYGHEWLQKRIDPNRSGFKNWHCTVALKGDKQIGFIIYVYHPKGCRKKGSGSGKRRADFFELFFIWIDKDSRRQGIASSLISHMQKYAEREIDIQEIRLHVIETNQAAINLYSKLGFEMLALKKDYPCRSVNSWRMRKYL